MNLSPTGFAFIRSKELFRPTAYKPTSADVWTAGYGHTKGVTAATTCTMQGAEVWLHEDVADAVRAVNELVTVPLTQARFDALVSFTFNLGAGALRGSTLLQKLNQGHYQGAADEMLRWIHQGKDVLHGLTIRRADERAMFLA